MNEPKAGERTLVERLVLCSDCSVNMLGRLVRKCSLCGATVCGGCWMDHVKACREACRDIGGRG